MLIEVFRAGNAAANAAGITASDLADVAAFDCAKNPVPNVLGHPKHDTPAHDAVVKFEAKGNSLYADIPEASPAFAPIVQAIKDKKVLGRSMGFFGRTHPSNPTPGKIAPKHLGFLGGAAVGIPGMPALASYFEAHPEATLTFSAADVLEVAGDPAPAVVFEAAPTAIITFTEAPEAVTPPAEKEPTVTPEEIKAAQDKLAKDQADHDARVAQFAADAKTARETANAATVDSLITANKVLPADKADLVAAFNAVDDGETITFASDANKKGSPVSIIATIMAKGGKVTPAGDGQKSPTDGAPEPNFMANDGTAGGELGKVRAERMAKYGK